MVRMVYYKHRLTFLKMYTNGNCANIELCMPENILYEDWQCVVSMIE